MLFRRSKKLRTVEAEEMFEFFPFQIVLIYFYDIIPSSSLLQAEVSYFI